MRSTIKNEGDVTQKEDDIRKIRVNGVELACRFDGPESGHVVMMSNSLMSDYTMWDITVPALTNRYRVLRYDTRGHGRSGVTPGPYSIEMLQYRAIEGLQQLPARVYRPSRRRPLNIRVDG
jgi:3-oxoadipate enol-lactonase